MDQYSHEPYRQFEKNGKVNSDLCNYALKSGLEQENNVDTLTFAKKTDLIGLKPNVNKVDIRKSKTVPHDLNQLRMFINNNFAEKTVLKIFNLKVAGVENKVSGTAFAGS